MDSVRQDQQAKESLLPEELKALRGNGFLGFTFAGTVFLGIWLLALTAGTEAILFVGLGSLLGGWMSSRRLNPPNPFGLQMFGYRDWDVAGREGLILTELQRVSRPSYSAVVGSLLLVAAIVHASARLAGDPESLFSTPSNPLDVLVGLVGLGALGGITTFCWFWAAFYRRAIKILAH